MWMADNSHKIILFEQKSRKISQNICLLTAGMIGALSIERKLFIEFNQKKIIIQFDLIRYC